MTTTAIAAVPRTVHLVELGQAARHPDRLSEDAVSVLRHRAAVLDGVSSLRPSIEGSPLTPGLAAVRAVVAALEDPTLRPDVPAAELVGLMHTAVGHVHSIDALAVADAIDAEIQAGRHRAYCDNHPSRTDPTTGDFTIEDITYWRDWLRVCGGYCTW